MKELIENKIKEAPNLPGVYQFFDISGDILYIGKAKNLKNRIKSYFLKEIGRGPTIDLMVKLATNIDFIQTDSEIEAIFLEAELINKLKPKYNARLKDDKSFLAIKISKPEDVSPGLAFPPVELVRFKNVELKDKSAWYFGPYPSGDLLRKSLHLLRKIFPYRDCSANKYANHCKKGRQCLYGDIRICPAPCVGNIGIEDYQKNIAYLRQFLKGKRQAITKNITREMNAYSKRRNFEEAKICREKLAGLEHIKRVAVGLRDELFDSSALIFRRIECYDISNIGEKYAVGSMAVFKEGRPDKDEYRKFRIQSDTSSDLERLQQVLERRFKNSWTMPDLIVIDGGELQLKVARQAMKNLNINKPVISISKGLKRRNNQFHFSDAKTAKIFENNKKLENICIASRDEAHRFAISYYRKIHIRNMLE